MPSHRSSDADAVIDRWRAKARGATLTRRPQRVLRLRVGVGIEPMRIFSSSLFGRAATRASRLALHSDPRGLLPGCHGFLVDGRDGEPIGVVDDVQFDESGHVVALDVASGWFGRHVLRVPVSDVADVDPDEQRVVVSRAEWRAVEPPSDNR